MSLYAIFGSGFEMEIDDEDAEIYNYVAYKFEKSQRDFEDKYGTRWQPGIPLEMVTRASELEVFNRVGNMVCKFIIDNAPETTIDELPSIYLHKI